MCVFFALLFVLGMTGSDGITRMLEDCYVGDTLITEENLHALLRVSEEGNRILVFNSEE